MNIDRIRWYAQRLRSMGPAELVHRAGEQAKRWHSRRYAAGWAGFDRGDGALARLPVFDQLEGQWRPETLARCREAADTARAGRISLLGQSWPPTSFEPGVWALDPVSGEAWSGPQTYCFDVDFRHARGRGDVKFAFELSRMQILHPVAALAIHDRDPAAARFCVDVILSWMDGNPPFRGVNWISGIELALRLVTVALVVAAAGGDVAPEVRLRLRALVAAHGFWLARFPSKHSSANNHLVAEGLGLALAGLLAPDLAEAPHWLDEGRAILADAPRSQFHPDGWGAEQSPTYTAFTLEMLALGGALLADAGRPLPAESLGALRRAAGALGAVLDGDGQAPRIGDDDEGRVLACPPDREPRYAASVLAALAGFLGEPELTPLARDPHWRDVLFGGPVVGPARPAGVSTFAEGGLTVVREVIADRDMLLAFDHGPLGFLSIAAHGHADALALWLHLDGKPVLVDGGTYLYSGGGKHRAWLRSSLAHSTLTIDEQPQSFTAGPFNWRTKARCRLDESRAGADWRVRASHDGYTSRFGVRHERTLERRPDGVLVTDRLLGGGPDRPAALRFHVHPDLQVSLADKTAVIAGAAGPLLRIAPPPGVSAELEIGAEDRPPWFSNAFNRIRPGQAVVIRTTTRALAAAFETLLEISPATP